MGTSDQYIAAVSGILFIIGIVLTVYKLRQRSKMRARWMK
jgi:hypothetical protein